MKPPSGGLHHVVDEGNGGRQNLRRGARVQRRVEPRLCVGEQQGLPANRRRLRAQLRHAAQVAVRHIPGSARLVLRSGREVREGAGGSDYVNPFLDRAGYMAYIDLKEKQFYAELERQKR